MKTFEEILGMTQEELKKYLTRFLQSKKYKVVNKDGYLYAKGDVPVLLVAHMDRHPAQDERVTEIIKQNVLVGHGDNLEMRWSSPQGICGDDRCGCWAIMNIVNELHCSVLFCEDEEKGSVGASKFCKTEYIKKLDVNYMIQIDRRGSKDLVFYRNDNRNFVKWLEEHSDYKEAQGSFTDICKLMPESGIAGVNISSGYYNEHHKDEYIVIDELNRTIETVKGFINTPVDKPFKFTEKKFTYSYNSYKWNDDWDDWGISRIPKYPKKKKQMYNGRQNLTGFTTEELTQITLTVSVTDLETGELLQLTYSGDTKEQCLLTLFMENPEVSFSSIEDFYWE